jgi:hypothetical protein
MTLETKRTLSLTKAEKKVLTDFYWNFYTDYEDDAAEDMYEVLQALAKDAPDYTSCEIVITG